MVQSIELRAEPTEALPDQYRITYRGWETNGLPFCFAELADTYADVDVHVKATLVANATLWGIKDDIT